MDDKPKTLAEASEQLTIAVAALKADLYAEFSKMWAGRLVWWSLWQAAQLMNWLRH